MILKIAGLVIEVKTRYKYTFDMCHDYLYDGDEKPLFTVFATNEELLEEQQRTPEFPIDIIENTCVYKNICREILKYNAIFIHSAAISVNGFGYMFSADSGTGKTTHMNLWLDKFGADAFVINGDKPILRLIDDKIYVFGTPWCGKEGLNKNIGVEVKAFYILKRAAQNLAVKVNNREALLFIITQTQIPNDTGLMSKMYDMLSTFISKIPVYQLSCNMEKEACEVAYNITLI